MIDRCPSKVPGNTIRENLLRLNTSDNAAVLSGASQMKERMLKEIFYPSTEDIDHFHPKYSFAVPLSFASADEYVKLWREIVIEHLNIQLWNKLGAYCTLMKNADISVLLGQCDEIINQDFVMTPSETSVPPLEDIDDTPSCDHGSPCKVARVSKSGPNTGRYFYACRKTKFRRCKFFKWADEYLQKAKASKPLAPPCGKVKIRNERALVSYLRRNDVIIFTGCAMHWKAFSQEMDGHGKCAASSGKRQLVIQFTQSDKLFSDVKDDLWLISKSFTFDAPHSLVVKVSSRSISSAGEVVVQALGDHSINEWNSEDRVNVLPASKSSLEFNLLHALSKEVHSMPLLPHLLGEWTPTKSTGQSIFTLSKPVTPQPSYHKPTVIINMDYDDMLVVASQYSAEYKLTNDQMAALTTTVDVMKDKGRSLPPIVIVDGVPGSGKTFLLAVILMFIFDLVTHSANQNAAEATEGDVIGGNKKPTRKWKILVTSNSDEKVDSLLRTLLQLGFDRIARVGNLERISSSLLPYSVHDKGGSDEQMKKLKMMFPRCGHSDPERRHIMKSMEQVTSGATKRLLHNALIVGATCDGALSPSIGYYKFPIIVIDDACSAPESEALLPLAKFSCEKLLLAGDSKLSFNSTNQKRLQQSLFQRLLDCGHESISLTTQWRYSPGVTSLLNSLYYDDTIMNGIAVESCLPLLEGLPPVCVYDVPGKEELKNPGDFYNGEEAKFIADLIKLLLSHAVPGANIVVITTYEAQLNEIKSELDNIDLFDMSDVKCIAVTAHAQYNIDEREIAIVSCVCSPPSDDNCRDIISFLTRVKRHVIFVGNVTSLSTNQSWKNVIDLLKQRRNGVQSLFQFRKLFHKNITSCEDEMNNEVPFLVLKDKEESSSSRDGSDQSESDDAVSTTLMVHQRRRLHDDDNSDGSDVIPVLRPKRMRCMITDNDDDNDDLHDSTLSA